jgi:malate dehydrogenase (oxaloacetate-decarboxylating)
MVSSMNSNPIIIAMANPIPEIMPDTAKKAGAMIVATGRSDFPNQVNNALAFPGVFRGAIDARAKITQEAKLASVTAIVDYHKTTLGLGNLMPSILDSGVHMAVARAVYNILKAH